MHLEEELDLIETELGDFKKGLRDKAMVLIKEKALALGHNMQSESGILRKHRWIESSEGFDELRNFIFELNQMKFEVNFEVKDGEFITS